MHLLKNGEDNINIMGTGGLASTNFANGITSSTDKVISNFAKISSTTTSSSSRGHNNKVLIYVATLAVLIIAFSSFSNKHGAKAMPRCGPPCRGEECEPTNCLHGVATNYCGKRVCAKGPGEVCGTGMFKMLGTCGDGLYCNCGRCIGCSLLTYECYDKTCA